MSDTQSPRPILPTSSSDFALPASTSSSSSSSLQVTDDFNPLLFRFRRPSLLAPKYLSDSRVTSPLTTTFPRSPLRPSSASESDRERMWADSSTSGSSENATPPLQGSQSEKDAGTDSDSNMKTSRPQTPPRNPSSSSMDVTAESSYLPHVRRLSYPPKIPRILNLVTESRPDENEVKSEAQFQRLVASFSELPMQPRTPRAPSDRGRYPEEAGDEFQREDTPSDDDDADDDDATTFSFTPPTTEPISISKARTPAASVSGSVNGDEPPMDSPSGMMAMDIDMPSSTYGSPSVSTSAAAAMIHQWRYTPPPTASAVRTNKRKYDDRFDPYQSASKRRAVSPSVSYLRETHSSLSPIYIPRAVSGRTPVPIPISNSNAGSVASSPTVPHNNGGSSLSRQTLAGMGGSGSVASSPTMRASMCLASPIARPLPLRMNGRRPSDGEDKEIDGAGDAVGGLTLG